MLSLRTTPTQRIVAFFGPLANPYAVDEDDGTGNIMYKSRNRMSYANPEGNKLKYTSKKEADEDMFPDGDGIRGVNDRDLFKTGNVLDDIYTRG